jgi:leucine dehydrogenase
MDRSDGLVFESPFFDGHELVQFATNDDVGLRAVVAVHSTARGIALGGCRMMAYPSERAGLTDALKLSRAMSYKGAAADIPFGGGKCVVLADPRTKRPDVMRALGQSLSVLEDRFIVGEDVGTSPQDMAEIAKEAPNVVGLPENAGGSGDPSVWTAEGCIAGIHAALRHRRGTDSLEGVRVAVQGLGNVGWRLAALLHERGAALTVTDIRSDLCEKAEAELGASVVDPDSIYGAVADVFAPCALGGVLSIPTVARFHAKVVAGCANNQMENERVDAVMREWGILYAPDYVINAGGMIRLAGELLSWPADAVRERVWRIGDTLSEVFRRSEEEGIPTGSAADVIARGRLSTPVAH